MKAISMVISIFVGSAVANASTGFTQELARDESLSIVHNAVVAGSTGGWTSIHDTTGNLDYHNFGTSSFGWYKVNTDSQTHVGYKVTSHADTPVYPASTDYAKPATVTYLDAEGGGGGGM